MKNKKTSWQQNKSMIVLMFFLIVLAILVSVAIKNKTKECGLVCNDIFLGICFDKDSEYYKCDMISEECNLDSWMQVNTIRMMEERDIKIYGNYRCGWCLKQLEEFGDYKAYLFLNDLFVDCDIESNAWRCKDITSTPIWKKGNQTIRRGYTNILPRKEVQNETNNN